MKIFRSLTTLVQLLYIYFQEIELDMEREPDIKDYELLVEWLESCGIDNVRQLLKSVMDLRDSYNNVEQIKF